MFISWHYKCQDKNSPSIRRLLTGFDEEMKVCQTSTSWAQPIKKVVTLDKSYALETLDVLKANGINTLQHVGLSHAIRAAKRDKRDKEIR